MTYELSSVTTVQRKEPSSKSSLQAARDILIAINGIVLLGPVGGVMWRWQADIDWRLESKSARIGVTPQEVFTHEQSMIDAARTIGAEGPSIWATGKCWRKWVTTVPLLD
ncbi:hypothetical protein JAV76_09665 [Sanguibacter sp. YZGR15]|uniref:Uncharacterized protein n=2 Tax=Sanguibacter suaedae TaxID=2795737 RepID=A0A934I6S6_9MICO|nr:hypothetical protein [Sanguibacter suaedae]